MSQAAASTESGISEAKLSKLERGVNGAVKITDIHALAAVYELGSDEKNHLRELAEASDSPGWYHPFDVDPAFAHFLEMEGAASTILIYEQELITGLFQTEATVKALRAKRPRTKGGADQGLRTKRQEIVFGANGPQIEYITSEAALRRMVGGPDVMRDQVRHLLKSSERPNVDIYVVPFAAGAHASISGAYEVMGFADGVFPETVYLESLHESRYEDAEEIVGDHRRAFEGTKQDAIELKEFISENHELA